MTSSEIVDVIMGPLELFSKSYDYNNLINTASINKTNNIIHLFKECSTITLF